MNIYGLWDITDGIDTDNAILVNASLSKLEMLIQGWERAEEHIHLMYVVISLSETREETIGRIEAGKATNITDCMKCKERKTYAEVEHNGGFCYGCAG